MVRITGWRAVALLLIAAAIAVAVVLALLWAAAVLAVLGFVLWLNARVIPRLARRLGVSRWVLDLLLLVALCAAGWLLGGVTGGIVGALVWLGGIGAPRAVGAWLRHRQPYVVAPDVVVIDAVVPTRCDAQRLSTTLSDAPD